MNTTIRTDTAEAALEDTAHAHREGKGPLAAWASDELRLDDGTVLVAGARRARDGGELLGVWRIHHLQRSGAPIAAYDLSKSGLVEVEPS